ncbi:TetR/AcrR family transcriptional regulator [Saccharothrix violaceirubra]|uniref:AcrR family transcriptional regulator n=1 Tax=Saccharothrix violaceirubra TaxID=413306 RepID=A0A7W7WWH7_9PSEU|nr:TetR/AcrR family transcriptional regulator [Saccharothrix violaceirubra]MBB4966394.1 AcrR family transcriptional regulator [Saccharothrix violaceirubra]
MAQEDLAVDLLWGDGGGPGLNVGRIVRAAVEVADESGLDGLSMRKVAERLGYTAMSLYRHVPGRDHLVDLMRDAVLAESAGPLPEGDWRAGLTACARRMWEVHRRHPWLAQVRGPRRLPGPNGIVAYERMLAVLAGTALAPAEVVAAAGLVGRFVEAEALVLLETVEAERASGVDHERWWGARHSLYAHLDRYPTLSALWRDGGFDDPLDTFGFGLARVLDGIELLIKQRDEKRDETCRTCGGPVEQPASGRPRAYCSRACQQRAYRRRRSG